MIVSDHDSGRQTYPSVHLRTNPFLWVYRSNVVRGPVARGCGRDDWSRSDQEQAALIIREPGQPDGLLAESVRNKATLEEPAMGHF